MKTKQAKKNYYQELFEKNKTDLSKTWEAIPSIVDVERKVNLLHAPIPSHAQCYKMAKHTLKNLWCEHRKIFKVCLSILQHYA